MVAKVCENKPKKAKKIPEKTITEGKIIKKKSKDKKAKVIKVEAVPEEVIQENVIITKKKKNRYIMPSESVTEKLVKKCVSSLFKLAEHQKKDTKIFEEESQIFAEIHPMKIQDRKGNVRL